MDNGKNGHFIGILCSYLFTSKQSVCEAPVACRPQTWPDVSTQGVTVILSNPSKPTGGTSRTMSSSFQHVVCSPLGSILTSLKEKGEQFLFSSTRRCSSFSISI